jgi:ATP-binding cassette subfamily F protein 3
MLIRLDDVHKSYGSQDVLCGATLQVNPGDHVGLVGRNGAGKTTIFRLVAGSEEYDKGQVLTARNIQIGLLAQQPVFDGSRTVREEALTVFSALRAMEAEMSRLEHLMAESPGTGLDETMNQYSDLAHNYEAHGGFTYPARAEAVLGGLGFAGPDLDVPADRLSGGQKARLGLARLLLAEPDLLLLDEPTNHLDVDAVEWLEEFLAEYKSAFVVISHDRFLLDRISTRIVEVESGVATAYTGNYSAYIRQREERRLSQARKYEQQQEMIARTEDFIRRNIAGQKTKQAKSRRKMLERTERIEAVEDRRVANFRLQDNAPPRSARIAGAHILSIADLAVGYGKHQIAAGISLTLQRGERLGLIGANGSGKTTFLRTLVGKLKPLEGDVTWSATVKIGYYDQELSDLDESLTVMDELLRVVPKSSLASQTTAPSERELRTFLARFLFTGDDVFKPVSVLSGGERSRLALAKLIYSKANVLMLDEPTNHLDIASREALESALDEYQGTILTVSHDRYFLDKIATEILHFKDSTVNHHLGGYSDFHEAQKRIADGRQNDSRDSSGDSGSESRPDSSLGGGKDNTERKPGRSALSKPRNSKSLARQARTIKDIEADIHLLEGELANLSQVLSSPGSALSHSDIAEAGNRHQSVTSRLGELYKEWETAGSEA